MAAAWRSTTSKEEQIIKWLLSQGFPGHDALCKQAETAKVSEIDQEASLQFKVAGPRAFVKRRVAVEAYYYDHGADSGPAINLLLHVVDGLLHELEVYKDDGSPIEIVIADVDLAQLRTIA